MTTSRRVKAKAEAPLPPLVEVNEILCASQVIV
jgi:hypothetical protein